MALSANVNLARTGIAAKNPAGSRIPANPRQVWIFDPQNTTINVTTGSRLTGRIRGSRKWPREPARDKGSPRQSRSAD